MITSQWNPTSVLLYLQTCFCQEEKPHECDDVMCMMHCDNGFQKDEHGCDICQCNTCPEVMCMLYCEHGFKKDDNGCDVSTQTWRSGRAPFATSNIDSTLPTHLMIVAQNVYDHLSMEHYICFTVITDLFLPREAT